MPWISSPAAQDSKYAFASGDSGAGLPLPADVLDFWFGGAWGTEVMKEKGPNAADQMPLWFGWRPKDSRMNTAEEQAALDAACQGNFGEALKACGRGEFDEVAAWQTFDGLYAKMILCDQISRNAFRGSPDAFAYDEIALNCVKKMYADGLHKDFEPGHFWFVFQPPSHSEDVADHEMNLSLLDYAEEKFGVDSVMAKDSVIQHKKVIDRFGRYPHRNKQLGRDSTPEEAAWLADVDNLPSWARRS